MPPRNLFNIDARDATVNRIGRDQFNVGQLNVDINNSASVSLSELLDPVDAGHSRSGPIARCLPDTRQRLIADIVRWVDSGSDQPICWLNGPAGFGKSAVSQTIAELCDAHNRLAASFFFFRGGDRSRIARFIPTLAYQLSISVPATKPFIQKVLGSDPLIVRQSLNRQFGKLIIEPVAGIDPALAPISPMLIVIDGLDECDDKELMAEFVETITSACRAGRQFPFRIFFTSRVEEHLRKKLEAPAARSSIYPLALQYFYAGDDIRTFFRSRFSTIYEENCRLMRNVPLPWPSYQDLEALVQKASGSFIFASTLINFVNDGSDLPHRKLPIALTAHPGLDQIYTQVLSTAIHCSPHFERILSVIMLLKVSPSINFLGHLLQLEAADILQALLGIQSILMIPGDNDQPIQLFHTSLRDFLTTKSRSCTFFIDPTCHLFIMTDCLKVMMMPLEDHIFCSGNAQNYAYHYWCHHFDQALIKRGDKLDHLLTSDTLMTCLTDFLSQSELWINTLISTNQVQEVLGKLDSLKNFLIKLPNLAQVLEEIRRLVELNDDEFWNWSDDSSSCWSSHAYDRDRHASASDWDDLIKKWRESQHQHNLQMDVSLPITSYQH